MSNDRIVEALELTAGLMELTMKILYKQGRYQRGVQTVEIRYDFAENHRREMNLLKGVGKGISRDELMKNSTARIIYKSNTPAEVINVGS